MLVTFPPPVLPGWQSLGQQQTDPHRDRPDDCRGPSCWIQETTGSWLAAPARSAAGPQSDKRCSGSAPVEGDAFWILFASTSSKRFRESSCRKNPCRQQDRQCPRQRPPPNRPRQHVWPRSPVNPAQDKSNMCRLRRKPERRRRGKVLGGQKPQRKAMIAAPKRAKEWAINNVPLVNAQCHIAMTTNAVGRNRGRSRCFAVDRAPSSATGPPVIVAVDVKKNSCQP